LTQPAAVLQQTGARYCKVQSDQPSMSVYAKVKRSL